MGTGDYFPGGKSCRGVKLTTHLHLVPRSKNAWSYTSTLQYVFMAWCLVKHRYNFTFTFTNLLSTTLYYDTVTFLIHSLSTIALLSQNCFHFMHVSAPFPSHLAEVFSYVWWTLVTINDLLFIDSHFIWRHCLNCVVYVVPIEMGMCS
jgi:hypothetical protein